MATEQAIIDSENRRRRQDGPWVKDNVLGGIVHCEGKPIIGCAAEVITGKVLLDNNQYGLPSTFEPDTGLSRLDRERNEKVRQITEAMHFTVDQTALNPGLDPRIGR